LRESLIDSAAKSVACPGAASADLRGPGAAAGVNPRLPCRATRDGRRGARALASPSLPLLVLCAARCSDSARGDVGAVRSGDDRRAVAQSSLSGWRAAATRVLSGRCAPGTRSRTCFAPPRA